MKKIILLFGLIFILVSCNTDTNSDKKEATKTELTTKDETASIGIPTYNYNELKPYLNKEDDKVYVVNFWATWCAPCVKELPYFEKVTKDYQNKNVEVLLVSLDFPKKKESKLIPFVAERNIQSKVLHLDDPNEQFWIADVSEEWSGALPATLIYNKNKRKFISGSVTQEELENEIQSFIN